MGYIVRLKSSRRRVLDIAFILILTGLLSACGTGHSSPNSHSTALQANGVTLIISPNVPIARHDAQVEVTMNRLKTEKHEPRRVWIVPSMPGMSMPTMKSILTLSRAGVFSGSVLFVMGGKWKLDVYSQSQSTQCIASFLIHVRQ